MPHPLAVRASEIGARLVGVTQRRQLAEIASDLQKLAAEIDAALADDADERIAQLNERIALLERCFAYDRAADGQTLIAGVARVDGDRLVFTIPAVAGVTQVPFTVASVQAQVTGGDLVVELLPDYA